MLPDEPAIRKEEKRLVGNHRIDVEARARRGGAGSTVRAEACGDRLGWHRESRVACGATVERRGTAESRSQRRWKQRGGDLGLAALMSVWAMMD